MIKRCKQSKICPTCNQAFHPITGRFNIQTFCKLKCIRRTEEFKKKVSVGMVGVNTWTAGKPRPERSQDKCHFWKGGVSQRNRTERQNFESSLKYKLFRQSIFKRDKYTCTICGDTTKKGHKILIQLDHIKPYRLYPELRMDENNVRTVCLSCHRKTDTYGGVKIYRIKKSPLLI